ncbi:T9SS type A sorting domain-containing protein [Seonamhaeicola maritimus]|uniref:T9SS type A sorting domain-containing protein n=2 Tax=Seonamhaeicola maritimus TaxID=2591822 RepID=A0A5C7GMV1_9FLAO|nr:T9SS type A sorting domain-containing protein [Seonamhaeicola maritimus]
MGLIFGSIIYHIMKRIELKLGLLLILIFLLMSGMVRIVSNYYVSTTLDDFFMPGSQPHESGTFYSPSQCDKCHGDYDSDVEPSFNYDGSMMAHSMRDPLFEASLSIANQDAAFSGDLCIRCHTPKGWLEGRSVPTDGSALTAADREGIQCHFCHKLVDPLSTSAEDLNYINTMDHVPLQHGNGMYVVDSNDNLRRGPYDDVNANHPTLYSSFHTKSEFCATCHDVSNPVFSKTSEGAYLPNTIGEEAPSFNKHDMFPAERTYSEWKMSAYNTPEGVPSNVFGGNKENVSSCIDCHMQDVTGKGSEKNSSPIRNDLALHDLTGGNTFIPLLIKDLHETEVDTVAINAGIVRAKYMLQNAATLNVNSTKEANGYQVQVEVVNETGHKLPSGYPEGRRIWINVQAIDIENNIIYESGAYNAETGVLNKNGTKIYEAKLGMSQEVADLANTNAPGYYSSGVSFHFALNNTIVKDNRIPPRGFTNANFESIQAAPVGYSYPDGAYSDTTLYNIPLETHRINVKLLYQTVSKEYIEFLRDKNVTDNKGQILYDLWVKHGKSAPVVMKELEMFTSTLNTHNADTLSNRIKLFPNPANNLVNVQFNFSSKKEMLLEIYSLNGVKIKTIAKGIVIPKETIRIETAGLTSGTYILNFKIDGIKASKMLIKK